MYNFVAVLIWPVLSIFLSVPYELLTRKQKGLENQNWCERSPGQE